jgi:magnesium-transporting ATPase (P-type)
LLLLLQGLPATVTSLLSLTALRLRDRNVLIKRTDIIENLGVATIIASDKTGVSWLASSITLVGAAE